MWNFDMNKEEEGGENQEGQLDVKQDEDENKGEYEEDTPFHDKI